MRKSEVQKKSIRKVRKITIEGEYRIRMSEIQAKRFIKKCVGSYNTRKDKMPKSEVQKKRFIYERSSRSYNRGIRQDMKQ